MSFAEARSDGTVEECLDELNDLMAGLQRYSPTVLAVGPRVHLGTLLQAPLETRVGTREQGRDLLQGVEQEAPQYDVDEGAAIGKPVRGAASKNWRPPGAHGGV